MKRPLFSLAAGLACSVVAALLVLALSALLLRARSRAGLLAGGALLVATEVWTFLAGARRARAHGAGRLFWLGCAPGACYVAWGALIGFYLGSGDSVLP